MQCGQGAERKGKSQCEFNTWPAMRLCQMSDAGEEAVSCRRRSVQESPTYSERRKTGRWCIDRLGCWDSNQPRPRPWPAAHTLISQHPLGQGCEGNSPEVASIRVQDGILQARLIPQAVSKPGVIDLVPIVDPQSLAALGFPRRGGEGQLSKKRNVVPGQGPGEEGPVDNDLVWNHCFLN